MLNIKEKISQAKSRLLLKYPFFGTLSSKVELIVNDDIANFRSNGIKLEYNQDYLQNLDISQMEFVFANAAMHSSLSYENRKNNRSSWLWQLSTDYAINDMLVENGFTLPQGANYSKRFSGSYAEEIYARLKEDILRDELEYEADETDDIKRDEANQDSMLEEQLFDEFAKSLLEEELQSGEKIEFIDRFFKLEKKSKINWRDELKSAVERFHRDNYTLMPPSKKLLYKDIYLPSCVSDRFKIVVAVDSSGSIDEVLLGEFIGELNYLTTTIQNYEITLLVCDDKIRSHQIFYSGDEIEVFVKGGGATDFRPIFEFIEQNIDDVKILLYFSDLKGLFPTYEPNYEVKWISKNIVDIPFGNIILLE